MEPPQNPGGPHRYGAGPEGLGRSFPQMWSIGNNRDYFIIFPFSGFRALLSNPADFRPHGTILRGLGNPF